uniref:hypothetical protein n=1 Tax=Herbidospora sakaeratensis TaxID=564415 RepID=UPI0012F877F6|nr:hypothetical protein [Herbidospora sakaeratensis]
MAKLVISDDGRYVAFSKVPEFKDPAMLFDMAARRTRLLPNWLFPIWISRDANRLTLASYSPEARLMTMSDLWSTSSMTARTDVTLNGYHQFGAP